MDQLMVRISSEENLSHRCLLLVVKLVAAEKIHINEIKNLPKNLNQSLMNIFSKRGYLTDQNIDVFLRDTTKVLELSECVMLSDESLAKISSTCKYLAKIDLNSNYTPRNLITSDGISNLARCCKFLHTILLRRCELVDDSCIQSIAANCPRLAALNIANCPLITDEALKALGRNCVQLQSINFSGTKVTDSGVFMLFSNPSMSKSLEEIHMSHCDQLTDESIECILMNTKKIKYLIFHSCRSITEASRTALEDYISSNSGEKIKHLTWTVY